MLTHDLRREQSVTQLSPHHDVGRSKNPQCIPTHDCLTITRITKCPKGKIDQVGWAGEALGGVTSKELRHKLTHGQGKEIRALQGCHQAGMWWVVGTSVQTVHGGAECQQSLQKLLQPQVL